jgi:hypothetical protein
MRWAVLPLDKRPASSRPITPVNTGDLHAELDAPDVPRLAKVRTVTRCELRWSAVVYRRISALW